MMRISLASMDSSHGSKLLSRRRRNRLKNATNQQRRSPSSPRAGLRPGVRPFFVAAASRLGHRLEALVGMARDAPARPLNTALGRMTTGPLAVRGDETVASSTTLSTQSSTTFRLARLLIEFANAHFFLDAAALDQLAEAANRLLRRLFVS
jgi:hypothetical protein